jgi:hypothetical protein
MPERKSENDCPNAFPGKACFFTEDPSLEGRDVGIENAAPEDIGKR